jgi:hypothetical protein
VAYGSGEPAGPWQGYSHYASPDADWVDTTIWFFGDSIGYGGRPTLTTQIEATGHSIAFDVWSSRPTKPAVDALEDRLVSALIVPTFVVCELGSNDIFDPREMALQVQRARDLCESYGVELIWIDTFTRRVGFEQADLINCAWINEAIHENITASRIVRWHRWFAMDKGRIASRLKDGIHPKPTEWAFWAATVMAVLGPLL